MKGLKEKNEIKPTLFLTFHPDNPELEKSVIMQQAVSSKYL
jgi:hypothetical protein